MGGTESPLVVADYVLVVVLASLPVDQGICSLIVGASMLVLGLGLIVLPRLLRRASA